MAERYAVIGGKEEEELAEVSLEAVWLASSTRRYPNACGGRVAVIFVVRYTPVWIE
jgi:hypothetical protein